MRIAIQFIVYVHFAIVMLHGAAHARTGVGLGLAGAAFVVLFVYVGPVAGALMIGRRPTFGTCVVVISMAGALVFGVVNHFVLQGADNIFAVHDAHALFAFSAMLLVISEFVGVIVAGASLWTLTSLPNRDSSSSSSPIGRLRLGS